MATVVGHPRPRERVDDLEVDIEVLILDEVEAALDDANIDRFLQLVRRFSDRAQFVIVTHQKRTMDAADVLYGVSMKDGATKVISRRLPREQKLAEAGPDTRAA